jgi:hypothetical protein
MSANTPTPIWLKVTAIIGAIWYAFGLLQFYFGASMDTAKAVSDGTITAAHGAAIDGPQFSSGPHSHWRLWQV